MNMRKLLIVVAATPAFVTGTQNLMNDAMTWVLILIPIAASLFCAWKAFKIYPGITVIFNGVVIVFIHLMQLLEILE